MREGFILTLQGCPVAFASAGVDLDQLPTGSADWPVGVSASAVIKSGLDVTSIGSWSESISPLEASFQGGGLNFRLNDKVVAYEGADRNIATYLFTRNNQDETQLAATLSGSTGVGGTFDVQVPHTLTGTNFVVWIEGEAILCSSVAGNTVTIQRRGFYGTKTVDHKVDVTSNYYPTVWSDYPGTVKQDVKLWRQDSSATSTVIWRGTCMRAPRLSSGGAQVELQCEHLWNRISQKKYNVPAVSTTFYGVDGDTLRVRFYSTEPEEVTRDYRRISSATSLPRWQKDASVLYHTMYIINTSLRSAGYVRGAYPIVGEDKLVVNSLNARYGLTVRGQNQNNLVMTTFVKPVADPSTRREPVFGFYQFVLELEDTNTYQLLVNGTVQTVVVKPWNNLQDTPEFTASGSVSTCLTRPMFVAELDKNEAYFPNRTQDGKLHLYPTSYNTGTSTAERGLLFLTGSAYFHSTAPAESSVEPLPYTGIASEEELNLRYSLVATHWLDILRYGLVERYELADNWDFTNWTNLKSQVLNPSVETEVLLEGGETWNDLFQRFGQFFGAAVTVGSGGKLRLVKLDKPSYSSVTVDTITTTDMVEKPSWESINENLVTTVEFRSDYLAGETFTINNRGAESRYGEGSKVEIDLAEIGAEYWFTRSKEQLAILANSRFFNLFSKPYDQVTFATNLSKISTVFPGDVVLLSDWLIPTGTGTRGLSSKRVLITERAVDLQAGLIRFKGMMFNEDTQSRGFAPCVKIQDVNIMAKTLTVSSSYLAGSAQDYAGSNLSPYLYTSNDAGIGFFAAGQRAQLILRDSTSFITASVTVQSVAGSTISINETLTTGSADWVAQAVSGNVDLRFDSYGTSGLTTTQKEYAYVGDVSDGLILGTDRVKRFT